MKLCKACGIEMPANRAPQARYCTELCKNQHNNRKYKTENKEKLNLYMREWASKDRAKNPEKHRKKSREHRLKHIEHYRDRERRKTQCVQFGQELEDLPYKEARKIMRTAKRIDGYKSGLEARLAEQIIEAGHPIEYEKDKIAYIQPESTRHYIPDFRIKSGDKYIYIEGKGRFLPDDRRKHLLVKSNHPNLDIRFVFTNSSAKIAKNSNTTYAMWCEKNGFQYAEKRVPDEWLEE